MEHPVLSALARAAFVSLGWFAPRQEDKVPHDARFVILIGNAGPAMFYRFARERDPANGLLDDWTREAVGSLARELDATAVFPFDKPPLPFLTWARRAGAGHVSPLGMNIHPAYGLWHAYRAALLFPVVFDLPPPSPGAHPCETCAEKPCLSACPAGAFTTGGYDAAACATHVASAAGQDCLSAGCLARRACPVGRAFTYAPQQSEFHMRAFLKARGID
ncbi:MAG: hypothetical protein ACREDU_13505, partial [Methylocella sp.]